MSLAIAPEVELESNFSGNITEPLRPSSFFVSYSERNVGGAVDTCKSHLIDSSVKSNSRTYYWESSIESNSRTYHWESSVKSNARSVALNFISSLELEENENREEVNLEKGIEISSYINDLLRSKNKNLLSSIFVESAKLISIFPNDVILGILANNECPEESRNAKTIYEHAARKELLNRAKSDSLLDENEIIEYFDE